MLTDGRAKRLAQGWIRYSRNDQTVDRKIPIGHNHPNDDDNDFKNKNQILIQL